MKDSLHQVDTRATSSGLLTATGAATTHDTTVAIQFCIDGKALSKGAITTGVTPTTDRVTAATLVLTASQGAVAVWSLNASGTVGVHFSAVKSLDGSNAFIEYPQFPYVDLESFCPFAYQVLKASSAAGTITFGSSNWNATGFTNTIVNVQTLPSRPKVS